MDHILTMVLRYPDGASLEDIFTAMDIPKRTAQRYLALLVSEGRIKAWGNARARRYYPAEEDLFSLREEEAGYQVKSVISLSPKALAIHIKVRQPIQARRPIGYNGKFLDQYRPNETFYLPKKTRDFLREVGKAPDGKRPAGTYARQILNRLLIDLSWNSSRLEGNTFSLLETERLLELGVAPTGKDSAEAQMILNHKAAIEFMVESADQMKFNSFTILNLHALLSDNLLHDGRACGSLRTQPIGIAKSVYQPLSMPQLIRERFQQILDTAEEIQDPFEQSFFVMVHLPYLQPFLDVNKRVSRLAANIPFIRGNLCPLSFVDVPSDLYISGLLGVYELNRIELLREVYIWAYERSSSLYSATRQELGEPDLFRLQYRDIIKGLVGDIVRRGLNKQAAVEAIKQKGVESLPAADRGRFLEVIETELRSLHKGNIARYRLKPAEYDLWQQNWH